MNEDTSKIHGEITIKRFGQMIDASVDKRMSVLTTMLTRRLDDIAESQRDVIQGQEKLYTLFHGSSKDNVPNLLREHERLMELYREITINNNRKTLLEIIEGWKAIKIVIAIMGISSISGILSLILLIKDTFIK